MANKIAIGTGGSAGIGKAIVEILSGANAIVVNTDIQKDTAETNNKGYFFYQADLTSVEEGQQLYDYIVAEVGAHRIFICKAGVGIHERLTDGDPEKWFTVINTNNMGTLHLLRSFMQELTKHDVADVFLSHRVLQKTACEYGGIYGATKAAIGIIAETLRVKMKEKVSIMVIAPDVVDMDFFKEQDRWH